MTKRARDSMAIGTGTRLCSGLQVKLSRTDSEELISLPTLSTLESVAPDGIGNINPSFSRKTDGRRDAGHTLQEAEASWTTRRRSQTISECTSSRRRVATMDGSASVAQTKRYPTIRRHAIHEHSERRLADDSKEEDWHQEDKISATHSKHHTFVFPDLANRTPRPSQRDENRRSSSLFKAAVLTNHTRSASAKDTDPIRYFPSTQQRVVLADLDLNTLPVAVLTPPARYARRRLPLAPWPPLDARKRRTQDSLDAVVRAALVAATGLPDPHPKNHGGHHPIIQELIWEVDAAIAALHYEMSQL